jgi:phosphoserine phosphatase
MAEAAEAQKKVLPDIVVVRINDELTVMFADEFEKDAKNAVSLGSPEKALILLKNDEVLRIRAEIGTLMADHNMEASDQVREFMEATQPFRSSPMSPLPALKTIKYDPENDNHTLLENERREPGVYWLAMIDLDNTLYEAESKHSIMLHKFAQFIHDNHLEEFINAGGNPRELKALITYCDKWEIQRRLASRGKSRTQIIEELNSRGNKALHMQDDEELIRYEKGIMQSGSDSAEAFKGMTLKKLKEFGARFVREGKGGKFFDYAPGVLQKIRNHGVLPVITTGLPDFLLQPILEEIGITHGKGTTYKTDDEGKLTGEVKINMGIAEQKAVYGKELTKRGYAIALAMGDSIGDMGLFRSAIFKSRSKEDINGAAILTNASDSAIEEVNRNYSLDIKDGRMKVVSRDLPPEDVVVNVGLALKKVFEPLHQHMSLKRNVDSTEQLGKFLSKLKKRNEKGKKHQNLENLKRIRDILKEEGLNDEQIVAELEKWYPPIIVQDIVKSHIVNTRNSDNLTAYLVRIGATRATIEEVLQKNQEFQAQHGLAPPSPQKRSTTPPPPLDDDSAQQEIAFAPEEQHTLNLESNETPDET